MKVQKNVEPCTISLCLNNFWSAQITFFKITCGETNQGKNWHCGVTKVSITYNMMHYERVPVSRYYGIAELASVRIIFGATVLVQHEGLLFSGSSDADITQNLDSPEVIGMCSPEVIGMCYPKECPKAR